MATWAVDRPAVNYLGQLRAYSYADLVLLVVALGAEAREVVGISLLWFGFIVYLEWRHRDGGRRRWPWPVWAALWIAGIAVVRSPLIIPFLAFAFVYAQKKHLGRLGAGSWLVNGALKGTLAAMIPAASSGAVLLVGAVTAVRNLAGDVRDARKDGAEGVCSLPTLVGYRGGLDVYPAALICTSILWTALGSLPWWSLALVLVVEMVSYPLTPR